MRHSINQSLLLIVMSLLVVSLCRAEQNPYSPTITHALELQRQGNPVAAITFLEPFVQDKPDALDRKDQGIAWAVIARSYQESGNMVKAQHDYEQAIQILKTLPAAGLSEYASALDNFGSLYLQLGQLNAADSLRQRALVLYRQVSDHAGAAVVLNNLAESAIGRNKARDGQKYLDEALEEAKHAPNLDWGNEAGIYTTKGMLLLMAAHPDSARQAFQTSIDLWQREFGPNHYWVGWGYVLRAQCSVMSGNTLQAEADVEKGSAILEKTLGHDSSRYAEAQLVYAQVLNAEGDNQRARLIDTSARHTFKSARQDACAGCSITANAFR